MLVNRIFLAEVNQAGVTLQSRYGIVEEGAQSVIMPELILYQTTEDASVLSLESVQLILEYTEQTVDVYGLYSFRNTGGKIVVVPQTNTSEIPFIKFPEGSFSPGFEPTQDSERFMATGNGFAIPPSENSYQLIAFSSLARANTINLTQVFPLPVDTVAIFTPVGTRISNPGVTDLGVQTIQNFTYQVYHARGVNAGGSLSLEVSGNPKDASKETSNNRGLIIGAIIFGSVLVLAGLWMYRCDKNGQGVDAPDHDYESSEDVMDAIIALDDLHARKKIAEKAYKKKREELKDILKEML